MTGLRCLGLLLLLLPLLSAVYPAGAQTYTFHPPIWILGDSGFTPENGVASGSGTPEDPYVIEGWDISVADSSVLYVPGCGDCRAGLLVENTTAHFVIRNVFVHDGPTSSANVVLKGLTNGRIASSRISDGNMGIVLWFTANTSVFENEISGFTFRGIGLDLSSSNLVKGNYVHDVGWHVLARLSSFNMFLGNVMERGSRGLSITRNSSFNLVEGNIIRDSLFGVESALDSHYNVVRRNTISVEREGILVSVGSRGNLVEENTVNDSEAGVIVYQALETRVRSNMLHASIRTFPPGSEQFSGKGIWILSSSNTWVTENTVTAPVGISICDSYKTFIYRNDLRESDRPIETCHPPN